MDSWCDTDAPPCWQLAHHFLLSSNLDHEFFWKCLERSSSSWWTIFKKVLSVVSDSYHILSAQSTLDFSHHEQQFLFLLLRLHQILTIESYRTCFISTGSSYNSPSVITWASRMRFRSLLKNALLESQCTESIKRGPTAPFITMLECILVYQRL
jgi:hypothetical protein